PAKRAASPLAFSTSPAHCGAIRAITSPKRLCPPRSSSPLSPPPIRRARPPARITPSGLLILRPLPAAAALFRADGGQISITDQPLFAGQADKALPAQPPDQRHPKALR